MIWNLGTWAFGLPNSSSHALIGSIMGVGLANQWLAPAGEATSGVDWNQATGVLKALLFSPLIGFALSALLLLAMKAFIKSPKLYSAPDGNKPPPPAIRGLLILTCTGVSFFHGSNDGQKGMGLIMLILIGAAPTAYALNRALPESTTPAFLQSTAEGAAVSPLARRQHPHPQPGRRPRYRRRRPQIQGRQPTHRLRRPIRFDRRHRQAGQELRRHQGHPGPGHVERA